MSNPRDNIEAKLGLSGPPLQTVRDTPPQIPDHELIRRIGQGAYGEVWLARNALGTERAVKIVYRDNFKDARPYEREFAGIRRFEPLSRSNEGFVDILQVGRDDAGGWFYYVMELADPASAECGTQNAEPPLTGPSDTLSPTGGEGRGEGDAEMHKLTPHSAPETPHSYAPRTLARDLHQRGRLPLADCLELGLTLTLALGHLHRHGLIHRDVKPSNIIYVGGVPKLADIGLVTEAQGANTFVGTEGFVPPEGPTSPQADLYALGKVLYEAAMGKDRHEFPEPFTQIGTDRESIALMELNAVLLRACAPDPRKRYATAEEMHADLALLHSGGSVKRRHQFDRQFQIAKQVGAAAIAATLLIGAALLWQRQQTQKMTRLANEKSALASENSRLANAAKQNELLTRQSLYAADMNLAQQALVANNLGLLRALLQNHVPKPGEQDLRGFEWRYLWEQSRSEELFCLRAQTDRARVVSFMPDGRHLATGGEDGAVRIWELDSRREVASLAITGAVRSVAFSSTGDRMAIVTADSLSLSDTHTWSPLRQFTDPGWFSPNGSYLLIAERTPSRVSKIPLTSRLLLLDPASYSVVKALDLPEAWKHPLMAEAGRWVAFSRDGMRIAVQCADAIRLFSLPDYREVGFIERQLKAGASANPFVRFSPDNQTLATLDSTGFGVRFWDTDSRQETRIIPGHADALCAASFSPDGSRLATCGADQTIKLWAVATGKLIRSFRGQAEDLSFSPDGKLLASVGDDGAVRLWDVEAKPRRDFFREPVGPIGFNAEPKLMAFGEDAKLSLIDPVSQLNTTSEVNAYVK